MEAEQHEPPLSLPPAWKKEPGSPQPSANRVGTGPGAHGDCGSPHIVVLLFPRRRVRNVTLGRGWGERGGAQGQGKGCEQSLPQKALHPRKGLWACWHPEQPCTALSCQGWAFSSKVLLVQGIVLVIGSVTWLSQGFLGALPGGSPCSPPSPSMFA